MSSKQKKVFVGISGGVDSATSAALLKRDGFDVTGVFIKIWSPEWTHCSMQEDRRDAISVCAALDIPFREIDCTEKYKREVVDAIIAEYKKGEVPNPDVLCNRFVKFGTFFDYAMKEGADFVATGHYARSKEGMLQVAVDEDKDQTYFLWTLKKDQLKKILFPVGYFKKDYVRNLANKFKVPVAQKKDSQGICFLGNITIDEFLSDLIIKKRGNVYDESGQVIGFHDGIAFLTIGSRHGFTLTNHGTNTKPHYIIKKDIQTNTITVSENPICNSTSGISVKNVHWISGNPPKDNHVLIRIHHRAPLREAQLSFIKDDVYNITFTGSTPLVSPGQSAVIYKDGICLGGGIFVL